MGIPEADPHYFPVLTKYLSFVDESGHSKDPRRGHVSLAGLVASRAAWTTLESEWSRVSEAHGLTQPFHMRDFSAFKGQFKDWTETQRRELLAGLMATIGRARAIPIGSVVSTRFFNNLSTEMKSNFRDPYMLAFQPLTYHLAVAASLATPPGPITMVYAHHPEHSDGLANSEKLWESLREHNPLIKYFMESYGCARASEHAGLAAADLWAYELGHHFDFIRPAGRQPRWAFREFVKLGLNYQFAHNFITYHDEHGACGVGRMARVQQWREISLYTSGFSTL